MATENPPRPLHHQYGALLLLILAALAFQLAAPEGNWARLVAVALQAATLVTAVPTARAHPWVIRLTIVRIDAARTLRGWALTRLGSSSCCSSRWSPR